MLTLVVIGSVVLVADLMWVVRHARSSSTEEQSPATWSRSFAASALLMVNVVYVLALGVVVVAKGVDAPGGGDPDPSKSGPVEEIPVRDPRAHLPLAGMEGFEGDDQDACDRLLGFFFNMSEALVRAQRVPPLMQPDIKRLAERSQCTIGEAVVQDALTRFSEAYQDAGLAPLRPFALLGQPIPKPSDALSSSGGTGQSPSEGVTGGDCDALAGLLSTMRQDLEGGGWSSPLTETQEQILLSGSCAAADPSVQVAIEIYRSALNRAGLAVRPELTAMTDPQ